MFVFYPTSIYLEGGRDQVCPWMYVRLSEPSRNWITYRLPLRHSGIDNVWSGFDWSLRQWWRRLTIYFAPTAIERTQWIHEERWLTLSGSTDSAQYFVHAWRLHNSLQCMLWHILEAVFEDGDYCQRTKPSSIYGPQSHAPQYRTSIIPVVVKPCVALWSIPLVAFSYSNKFGL